MKERKRKSQIISDEIRDRTQRVEALVEDIASRLERVEAQFKEETGRARELETKIFSQIAETQRRVSAVGGGQTCPESVIALEEGSAVDMDEWAKKIDEKYAAFRQSVASRLNEIEIRIAKRSGETKPARLVSFLVDIGKKH
jgi:hypothetical protein